VPSPTGAAAGFHGPYVAQCMASARRRLAIESIEAAIMTAGLLGSVARRPAG